MFWRNMTFQSNVKMYFLKVLPRLSEFLYHYLLRLKAGPYVYKESKSSVPSILKPSLSYWAYVLNM